MVPEQGVPVCELERDRREDHLKVAPVLEVSRTKEARAKDSIREASLGKCLSNGRLSGPCKTIQPKYTVVLFVLQPMFKLQKEISPCSPQTSLPVPRRVPSIGGMMYAAQETSILISLFTNYYAKPDHKGARLTIF